MKFTLSIKLLQGLWIDCVHQYKKDKKESTEFFIHMAAEALSVCATQVIVM